MRLGHFETALLDMGDRWPHPAITLPAALSRANLQSAARSAKVVDRSPEDRNHCGIAIISDHPLLDLFRLKRGQPHRNFAV